jgi:hypothetical protein
VVEAGDRVIGFAVAYRIGETLHIMDLQLSRSELAGRLFEVLHALAAWPDFEGTRVVEADRGCVEEVQHAVQALSKSRAPSSELPSAEPSPIA